MARRRTRATEAIVVRVVDYREADRIVGLLTEREGRVSALARGARRSARRFAGLAALARGTAELADGPGELASLEGFEASWDPAALVEEVVRLALASYGVELAYELTPPGQPEPEVFAAVTTYLDRLAAGAPNAALPRWLELRVFDAVGHAPVLDRCVRCQTPATDGPLQAFDPAQGGVVCGPCRQGSLARLPGPSRLALLALRGAADPGRLASLAPGVNGPAREAMLALGRHLLGKTLRSAEFLLALVAPGAG